MAARDRGTKTLRVAVAIAAAGLAVALLLASADPAAAVPTNTSPPTIGGPEPRQDGQTLTANPGSWSTHPETSVSYRYQWFACGATCDEIAGATGQSYTLTAAEVGKRVKVRVYANCNVPLACTESSADSAETGTVLPDPRNEGAPQVSGVAQEGQPLAASAGFWRTTASLSFAYQWLRCDGAGANCSNVSGATGSEYRLTAADAGSTVRVAVTASNARPRAATALSPPTAVVTRPARRGPRLLSPFPTVVVAGLVTGRGAKLTEFTVRGPRGSIVRIRCRGRSCPFRGKRLRLRSRRVRVRRLERTLQPGVVITVVVTKRGFIGKYTRLRIRRGRVPARVDRCVRPGARRPSRCPRRT